MQLKGKVALITGAGSGIGKAAAILLAQQGAKIAALGRSQEEVCETVDEIERGKGMAMPVVADISDAAHMELGCRQVAERWGRIDIVFANAGINGVWAPLGELAPEEWDETLDINLKGTFLTVKYSLPWLKKRGGSVIIT